MTDIQLYLTIGIPSLLVVLSWINNNYRFTALDRRIDGVEKRLDRHDLQLEQINQRIDSLKSELNQRIDDLRDETRDRIDDGKAAGHKDALEIMRQMTALHERVARVEVKQAS